MQNIGFIVALNTEVPHLFRDTFIVHRLDDKLIKVVVSGMGPKRAGQGIKRLCENIEGFFPDYIINIGYCGATNDELKIGDLVIANQLSFENQKIQLDSMYINKLKNIYRETKYYIGGIETFSLPVFSRNKVSEGVLAVDMESFAIGETAIKYNMPVIVLKVVSDMVPQKVTAKNIWAQLNDIITRRKYAQNKLNEFVENYFYAGGITIDGN